MTYFLCALALLCGPPAAIRRLEPPAPRSMAPVVFAVVAAAGCFLLARPAVALAAVIVAGCAWWFAGDLARARKRRRSEEAVATFLGVMAADLRAGATTARALRHGAQAVPPNAPVAAALHTAAGLAAGGGAPETALSAPELRRLGHLLRLSTRHGVALAGLVEQAQSQLDTARRHARSTDAALQGPQATALILACLPLAGVAMGGAMGANSLAFLLGGGLGGVLLVVGVALSCGGFVWSRLILRKAAS